MTIDSNFINMIKRQLTSIRFKNKKEKISKLKEIRTEIEREDPNAFLTLGYLDWVIKECEDKK